MEYLHLYKNKFVKIRRGLNPIAIAIDNLPLRKGYIKRINLPWWEKVAQAVLVWKSLI